MSEKLIWSDMAREKLAKVQLPMTLKNFEQNEDGSSLASYTMKVAAEVADLSNKHLVKVIIEAAKAAGISDLTIVDEPSIMDYFRKLGAIKRNKCVCPYCGEPVPRSEYRYPQQTNADRIRTMTDEELAKFFHRLLEAHEFADCPFKRNRFCPMSKYGSCTLCAIDWLKQEAEG